MRIGLVPMAAKPYHAGHDELVRLAARENDEVHLYVSLSDRDSISGEGMRRVWKEHIEPTLPSNVKIVYGGSPVGNVFKEVGDANANGSTDDFTIYSDPVDAAQNYKKLDRYAETLLANNQLRVKSVKRTSTVDVSGTQMRQWFDADDKKSFIKYLPPLNGEAIWTTLKATMPGATKKAAPGKKPK